MNTPLKLALVVVFPVLVCSPASAQSCAALPKGPQRAQCIRQNHPQVRENRLERCKALAVERGSGVRGGGKKDFIRSCLQGKLTN